MKISDIELAAAMRAVEAYVGQGAVTVHQTRVYEGELAKSVEGSGYFDAVIPAEKLLGM